jgi:diguanylate cyclase (GGDEF)-like protein
MSERFEVVIAHDPYEAMAHFVRHRVKLLVVSLEVLRKRDKAFIEELRRFAPDLRVILLYPVDRRKDLTLFMQSGVDVLLSTPFYEEELRLLVRSTIRADGTDPLTLLPNRGACERACDRELARAKREKTTLGLGLFDIDDFKKVNDKYGYAVGDEVLKEVAQRLHDATRATDPICRWGGEEFLLLLTALPLDVEEARAVACQALRRALEVVRATPVIVTNREGLKIHVTVSAGLGLYPHEGTTCEDVFDVANGRLLLAKTAGKDQAVCPDPEDDPPN